MTKRFIDTGVLLAAADVGSPERCARARALIRDLQRNGGGVLSTQVLQEFYLGAVRVLGIEPRTAKALIRDFAHFEVVTLDTTHLQEAIDVSVLDEIPLPDALILVAAASARCPELLSSSLPAGSVVHGVRVLDPMAEPQAQALEKATPRSAGKRRRRRTRRERTKDRPAAKTSGAVSSYQPELGLEP